VKSFPTGLDRQAWITQICQRENQEKDSGKASGSKAEEYLGAHKRMDANQAVAGSGIEKQLAFFQGRDIGFQDRENRRGILEKNRGLPGKCEKF
jgi:hypothetical protein